MFANDLKAMAIALFGCGLLGCAAESGAATTHALTSDAAVPIALEAPEGLEEAASPEWRLRVESELIDGCSGQNICESGEQCCPLTGECVPADCDDCCVNPEVPAGPNEDPELERPIGPSPEPR